MSRYHGCFFKQINMGTGKSAGQQEGDQEPTGMLQGFQIKKVFTNVIRTQILQDIQYLFFCLLQFVFHLHYAFLDRGIVGFGAGGVDFASDFLKNK